MKWTQTLAQSHKPQGPAPPTAEWWMALTLGLSFSWELIKHFTGIASKHPHNNLGVMSPFYEEDWSSSPTPDYTDHV